MIMGFFTEQMDFSQVFLMEQRVVLHGRKSQPQERHEWSSWVHKRFSTKKGEVKRKDAVGFTTLEWAQKEQIMEYEEEAGDRGRRKEVSTNR